MANVTLATQDITRAVPGGVAETFTGGLLIANNYFIQNDGRVFLHFKKTAVATTAVTVVTPGVVDGNAIADPVWTVPASTGDIMFGPFRPEVYNDPTTGLLQFTLGTDVVGLTVSVMRLP